MKHVWELSRGQVFTVLAAAYSASGDLRYADRCAELLTSFWAAHAEPRGEQWTSGVELGVRMINWVWVRRLLCGWAEAGSLFEHNELALRHLYLCQDRLYRFPSKHSSANNHSFAEAAGLLAGSCAFPWFEQTATFRSTALERVVEQLNLQVSPCGAQREQAFDYHCFVFDLAVAAISEAWAAELNVAPHVLTVLRRMADVLALSSDSSGRGPRFGDSDDSCIVAVDPHYEIPSRRSLALGAAVLGPAPEWPLVADDLRSILFRTFTAGSRDQPHAATRTSSESDVDRLADEAGMVILRARREDGPEIWTALRSGPFGYLSIAAHAHADQLSVELRIGDLDVLVDPGTFSYEAHPGWRRFLRSTAAHNTLALPGIDQAESWGPFTWGTRADGRVTMFRPSSPGVAGRAHASHDGYSRLPEPASQARTIETGTDRVVITDSLVRTVPTAVEMHFLLGPELRPEWIDASQLECRSRHGLLSFCLPSELSWKEVRGGKDGYGWVSPRFGVTDPTSSLIGTGTLEPAATLVTSISWSGPCVAE